MMRMAFQTVDVSRLPALMSVMSCDVMMKRKEIFQEMLFENLSTSFQLVCAQPRWIRHVSPSPKQVKVWRMVSPLSGLTEIQVFYWPSVAGNVARGGCRGPKRISREALQIQKRLAPPLAGHGQPSVSFSLKGYPRVKRHYPYSASAGIHARTPFNISTSFCSSSLNAFIV